jgi:phytoene dehydrogenase-like protein
MVSHYDLKQHAAFRAGDESINDPSRVPPGRGMFHGITFGPGRWDEIREQMGDRSLRHYQRFISNLTSDNIVARSIVTPLDHARNMPTSMVGGGVYGAGCATAIRVFDDLKLSFDKVAAASVA